MAAPALAAMASSRDTSPASRRRRPGDRPRPTPLTSTSRLLGAARWRAMARMVAAFADAALLHNQSRFRLRAGGAGAIGHVTAQ